MKKQVLSVLLIVVMAVCAAGVLWYPISKHSQKASNDKTMETLRAMRISHEEPQTEQNEPAEEGTKKTDALPGSGNPEGAEVGTETDSTGGTVPDDGRTSAVRMDPGNTETLAAEPSETAAAERKEETPRSGEDRKGEPQKERVAVPDANVNVDEADGSAEKDGLTDAEASSADRESADDETAVPESTARPYSAMKADEKAAAPESTARAYSDMRADEETAGSDPAENTVEWPPEEERRARTHAPPYDLKDKVAFDEKAILPEYREIYEENNDLVGWLSIPGTSIDHPVLRNADPDYYLSRDFWGEHNYNGQLTLDEKCDAWTPSYNLVISGHNMKDGSMFGYLSRFRNKSYWSTHKILQFDTVMRKGEYVIVAAFESADYDEDEEGFRYNADIRYRTDLNLWMEEVRENQLYDTGIDVEFGDELLTLTTCFYQRRNGRFVVIARRLREGEEIE